MCSFIRMALCVSVAWAGLVRANDNISVTPVPDWALSPPAPTDGAAPPDAPVRVIYTDTQVRIGAEGTDTLTAYRIRLLSPEALQLGNVGLTWKKNEGTAIVHHVRVHRGDAMVDVLENNRFSILQREEALEQSMLSGLMTASLQIPGLQIGDEIEVAATIRATDATVRSGAFGIFQLPFQGVRGAFRYRLLWPEGQAIQHRALGELEAEEGRVAGLRTLTYELRDPSTVVLPDGAPLRFRRTRLVEHSAYRGWADVADHFRPLYEQAARLAPQSPVRAEAARIAASTADPAERAVAALALVQQQTRYVYVGLDGGNFQPASADETWQRRFGDCKGKTALLLALLGELGIEAEPVLVNAGQPDDGLDGFLPSPGLFNHVLVRARIDGAVHWLDGTRVGDTRLDRIPPPGFRFALPLADDTASLTVVEAALPREPQFIQIMDVDATAGFDDDARYRVRHMIRGDEAYGISRHLAGVAAEDADRTVRAYWRGEANWIEPETVAWAYEPSTTLLTLDLDGTGSVDWDGDETEGRTLYTWGGGFNPPPRRRRPSEQDQTAAWATEYPEFRCHATTIRLPSQPGFQWTYSSEPIETRIGGASYRRRAGMSDGIMRTVRSLRFDRPEISADEARVANDGISGFNNHKSWVSQTRATTETKAQRAPMPFADDTDWTAIDTPCQPDG